MKTKQNHRHLTVIRSNQPAYPNAADPRYFAEKALNLVTALVSEIGFVGAMVFLVTMV